MQTPSEYSSGPIPPITTPHGQMTPSSALIQELMDLSAAIAQEVGGMIQESRESGVHVANTKSSLTDVVTEADEAAEQLILNRIVEARPDDAILGEEGADRTGSTGITWVIDPIDGTVNYLYDIPAYCVSIAACVSDPTRFADGRTAIAGSVSVPRTGEVFHAGWGLGSYRNGEPTRVNDAADLQQALVGTGFGYTPGRRREQATVVAHMLPLVRDIRRIGSAAYDLCLLASGRLDAFYEHGLQPWDYAAAALIAREAGATIIGRTPEALPGEPFLIAANEPLAVEIQRAVQAAPDASADAVV